LLIFGIKPKGNIFCAFSYKAPAPLVDLLSNENHRIIPNFGDAQLAGKALLIIPN